jgi:hypothetical protein
MVESRGIEHSAPGQHAIDLAERAAPGIADTDGLEDNLPLVVSTPAYALAVIDHGRVVGVLRLEDIQHLVGEDAFHDRGHAPTSTGAV